MENCRHPNYPYAVQWYDPESRLIGITYSKERFEYMSKDDVIVRWPESEPREPVKGWVA